MPTEVFCGVCLRIISHKVLMNLICNMCSEITLRKFLQYLPWVQWVIILRMDNQSQLYNTVFFKTRGHLSRLTWPTQRDGLSCLASPRLALRCAAWPCKTSPDSCSRPVATSGCSHRYYNDNAKCINIAFFSVSEAMFRYKNDCLKWQNIILKK